MSVIKIREETLYSPIINYLQKLGFQAFGQTKLERTTKSGRKYPDILFKLNSSNFVIEAKIGKPDEVGLEAIAQAYDYANLLGTRNIIILIYPKRLKNQVILDEKGLERIALDTKIHILAFTENLTDALDTTPKEFFESLRNHILVKRIKISFQSVVKQIEQYVKDLNSIIYQIRTDELVGEVVKKLDLFSAIGEIKDKEMAKKQVINLASYLLFNQLLFYHIYKKKSKNEELPELEEIKQVEDIQEYFKKITNIDYEAIYRINILGYIPNKPEVIDVLNAVIKAIKLLRAEHITHDLAGRFFHDLIPHEVRKVLAAFYTHPVAAEILAGLTIDAWDERVIDPACGSGTLLVAAYKRKMELYKQLYGLRDLDKIHKKFLEEDITGIDIMPFAAHITTLNLATQNIEQETNVVRIATRDSLELADSLKIEDFKKRGILIPSYSEVFQQTLFGASGQKIKKGALSPSGKGKGFYLEPVDVVIMNPPFSDREKMPADMREKIKNNKILGKICGHQINLWGYFLALADLLLKPNGKIGAVIPINIARGKATEKIRNYLLENYHIKYIIKPVSDIAFSEGASFRDVLFIAEKRKPKEDDITGIIFLKKSIRYLSQTEIDKIVTEIKGKSGKSIEYKSNFADVILLPLMEITKYKRNLMPFIGIFKPDNIKIFSSFINKIEHRGKEKITTLESFQIEEGFHASPAGLSELTFITGYHTNDRMKRAFLMLEKKLKESFIVRIKDTKIKFKIDKSDVIPALRTLTGINTFFVKDKDYFIKNQPAKINDLILLSKWKNKKEFDWSIVTEKLNGKETYLVVARRFRPDSPNTHFFAFYNDEKFVSPHTFKIIKTDKDSSKYQSLFLNSVIVLLNIIMFREQTTEGYTDIMESDLNLFKAFNVEKLLDNDKKLLDKIFDKLRNVEFPSILEQLENRFWARVELDKTILKILGFTDGEINEWLPKVYDAIVEELKAMKKVK